MKKIIILFLLFGLMLDLTAQRQNKLDTLNIDQLNVYLDKAVRKIKAGKIAAVTGVGIVAAGWFASAIWQIAYEGDQENDEGGFETLYPLFIGSIGGIPTTLVGLTFWAIGDGKKIKAEIAVQKINIVTENSMALRLGISFRF